MKCIIVGRGVQGIKRRKFLKKKEFICFVDKFNNKSEYKTIYNVPLRMYDAVLLCVPDDEKFEIIKYCLENNKHVLVEKPLIFKNKKNYFELDRLIKKNKTLCYIGYNHRFEPGILKIKEILDKEKNKIGKIYRCKIFYGNGTARLVKKSNWRDKGKGVVTDIGSHLIDMSMFWFGDRIGKVRKFQINKLENRSPDHCMFQIKINRIIVDLEATLCMWKNSFQCDLIGSKGSIHLNSLTKWSKSHLIIRKRKFPSGYPKEKKITFKKGDPTWRKEIEFFKKLIKTKKLIFTKKDLLINKVFKKI